MGHDAYFKAWAASVARSVLVIKSMLGEDPVAVTKSANARASVAEIVRATKAAVMDAASAELMPQLGRFEGLDEGVTVKREGFTWRTAEVARRLEKAGFVKTLSEGATEDVVLFERGAEVVAIDTDGEFIYRTVDETLSGDDLRDLVKAIEES